MSDPTPTRAKLVLEEVLMGRVEPTKKAVRAHVDDMYSGLMEIERTTVVSAVMKEIRSWKPQEEKEPMTKPKKVLKGKATIPVAAGIWREEPDLTSEEVYQRMLSHGHRISMNEASFGTAYAPEARRLAESGEAVVAPPPPSRDAEPEPEPAQAAPVPEQAADEGFNTESTVVAPAGNGTAPVAEDGDYVRFQLGGQKLDAERTEDEWDVAFEGTVGDRMVRELLGRMFGGP